MLKLRQFIINFKNKQINRAQYRQIKSWVKNKEIAQIASLKKMHSEQGIHLDKNKGNKVLELGCGPGKYVAMLSSLGFEVTGIDPIKFEKTWSLISKKENVKLLDGIHAESLPFENQSFDHLLCTGALLYFKDPVKSMQEMRRVMRPGGTLVLRTVNRNNRYTMNTGKKLDPASLNLYVMDELKELTAAAGFEIKTSFSYGFWPPRATDLYWYLQTVWMPDFVQDFLSEKLPEANRLNNTVVAIAK